MNNTQGKIATKSTGETFDTLCRLLEKEKKVFYSRFGDGDIYIMMGLSQQNHDFHPELQKEMVESFEISDAAYLKGLAVNYPAEKGMYKGFMKPYRKNDRMLNFLLDRFGYEDKMVFESAWFTHYYSIYKYMDMISFLDNFIRPKKKLFIGCIPKHDIEKLIGPVDYYVEVPSRNSYWEIDHWWQKVMEAVDKVEVVIPAAGMSTRVINKRLWKLDKEVHSIDLGSIVDTVSGKRTRRWIRLKSHVMHRILLPPHNQKSTVFKIKAFLKEIKFYLSCAIAELK